MKIFKKTKRYINDQISKKGMKGFIWSVILITLIFVASLCLAFALYIIIKAPNFDKDLLYSKEATVIYDVNGNEFARIGSENRDLVTYDELPQVFIDALLATEDSRFFQHNGVDIARFLKASFSQVTGNSGGGASTITMQLVKNVYTDNTASGIKGIIRKFTDIYMAVFKIENCYTKEEIMEFYVNSLWLGYDGNLNYDGIYGVEAAAQYYFGKSISELTLAESSLLVGMYQNAAYYNPYTNPEGCRNRQNTVLKLMVNHGYITQDEMDAVLQIPVESMLVENGYLNSSNEYQAVIDYIIDEVIDKTENDPRKVTMKIYSTIDTDVQNVLTKLEKGELFNFYTETDQEGVAITSSTDGSIVALSGGRNYQARGLNRATDIKRQPGSTAKPLFDYAPYIEKLNASTGEYFFDEEYTYSNGTAISNSDNKYQGMITMRTALMGSRNIPALQAFQRVSKVDISYIEDFVHSVGINYGENLYESASIGGFNGVSPLELSAAYGTFARGGYYIEPYIFTKIVYEDGTKFEYKVEKKQVISEETAYMITSMLEDVTSQTTDKVTVSGTDVAGKTGTTNLDETSREKANLPKDLIPDTWFVSYTPEYVISLWYGYDENNSENYMTVLTGWNARRKIMQALATNIYSTNKRFTKPSGVVEVTIEKESYPLVLASEYTPDDMKITELFKEGTEPTEVSFRYAKLSAPTDGKSVVKGNSVTISWTKISTPKAIDNNYLQQYFDDNFGIFASKYYEKRVSDNATQLGSLGYRVYMKDSNGNLTDLGWYNQNSYQTTLESGKTYTFIIKSEYSIFKSNASDGLSIKVTTEKSNADDNTDEDDKTNNKTNENTNNTTNTENKTNNNSLD